MKIYVDDELPKCCRECGFCCKDDLGCWCQGLGDGGVYILDEILKEKRLGSCPLTTTQSLKQQVREEVVEEIKKQLFNHFKVKNIEEYEKLSLIDSLFTADTVIEILDTILKKYGGEDE